MNSCDPNYVFRASISEHSQIRIGASNAIHNSKVMETAKMPTTDEWIKKMWYLYTMEFYAAMKKDEILSFTSKWMELENILSEISLAQKTKNHMSSLICGH
jgi:hypothetical protein